VRFCLRSVRDGKALLHARSLTLISVIALSCVVAASGGSDAVTVGPSTTTFSRAGYEALSAYLRLAVKLIREA
jgi:hypothetical protein